MLFSTYLQYILIFIGFKAPSTDECKTCLELEHCIKFEKYVVKKGYCRKSSTQTLLPQPYSGNLTIQG